MLYFLEKPFASINHENLTEFYSLRKKTFKDRLDWAVKCQSNMEFDEYDNENTTYIFGVKNDTLICSVRFIETRYPNMITHTFRDFFDDFKIPEGNFIESSRFFVDKERASMLLGKGNSVTHHLFLAMVNYARKHHYDGILTIVSHAMMLIIKRSGWNLSVICKGSSEKKERVYLLHLPVDDVSQAMLQSKVSQTNTVYLPTAA
ncbi:acyl-homoserine-lactone synthase [Klebsiella aerogenes]|uniref:acyl-homoserine-lactone synthase n=1 Tax=Klebsiella aerogenes TaxID=548 RepID=UPI001F47B306|nr:acyl-homoserine-lactone synthase [Klebsiella aerogenes]